MPDLVRFQRIPMRQSEGRDEGGGSFTDTVFDDEYYGRDRAGGRARTIALALGVLVGAVIAGTAAWYVFGPGGSGNQGQTPLIVAEPEPFKVRPADPGGLQVENQDKLVYERVGGATPEAGIENILPPPEAPKLPIAAVPEPKPPAVETAVESPTPPAASPVAPSEPVPDSPAAPTKPEPHQVATPDPAIAVQPEPMSPTEAAPQAPVQTLESMVAALSGDYLIQIAALRSEDAAQGEWKRVSGRHPTLLSAYQPMIVQADLGERGIFYRLRAGPLADRSAAEQLCAALAAENVGCLVVRNE